MSGSSRQEMAEHIADLIPAILHGLRGRERRSPPDLDITLGQLHCLKTVGDLGAPTMSGLARELDLQPSTVTGLVDALVARGLVERREDPEDRRIVRVAVTAVGQRHRQQHHRARRRRLVESLAPLGDEELERVESALECLRAAVCAGEAPEGGGSACEGDDG